MTKRVLGPQLFPDKFQGLVAVHIDYSQWAAEFRDKREGDTASVEMHATATVGTTVRIRYGLRGKREAAAAWECTATVIRSEQIKAGTPKRGPRFRTTFVLMSEPETIG